MRDAGTAWTASSLSWASQEDPRGTKPQLGPRAAHHARVALAARHQSIGAEGCRPAFPVPPGFGNVLLALFSSGSSWHPGVVFMGAFARCSDEGIDAKVDCIDGQVNTTILVWNSVSSRARGRDDHLERSEGRDDYSPSSTADWKSDDMNFDNIFNARRRCSR